MTVRPDRASSLPRVRKRAWALSFGLIFVLMTALLTGVFAALGRSVADALAVGAIYSLGQTALQAWFALKKRKARHMGGLSTMTRTQREAAVLASLRGPVPQDPVVRSEAARLTRCYLSEEAVQAGPVAVVFALVVTGLGVAAVFASAWWWLVAGVLMVFGVILTVVVPRRNRQYSKRLVELET